MLQLLALTLVCIPAPQGAKAPAKPKAPNSVIDPALWSAIIQEGKDKSQADKILDHLVNRIGPRLSSSDNLQNACEWARDYLKSLGYENARLERWGEFPVGFNRGPWTGEVTAPKGLAGALVCNTMAWSAGTKGKQEGPAIWAPKNLAEAEELGAKLKGCWLVRQTPQRRGFSTGSLKLERYVESQGALGWVYSGNETRRGRKPGNIVRNVIMTGGNRRIRWDKLPTFPSIQVRWDQFQKLAKALDDDDGLRLAFDIRNYFKKGPIPLYNVVAELEGSEKPEEFVVVSGHLDSWDGATGTTDNGTGSATTLEAARILKAAGAKPRRTIRFCLWTGEEQGLMGSRAWVNKHRADVTKNCQANLNHDGGTNYASGILGDSSQMPLLQRCFAAFETIDPRFPFEVKQGQQPSYGSDHVSFISVGVPGFYWQQSGVSEYRFAHHTQHDTYEAAIPEYQKQTSTVAALGALALANVDERVPGVRARRRGNRAMFMTGARLNAEGVVTRVSAGSIMARSGLEVGDKIVTFDGNKLPAGNNALRSAFTDMLRAGKTKAVLVVERDGKKVDLNVEIGRRGGGNRRGGNRRGGNRRRGGE